MHSISEIEDLIKQKIEAITLPDSPAELYSPIKYILSLGGKRMRPSLVLMACDLFGGNIHKALPGALAIEVFHNFTLLHDDIMDNAPLRRGQATVHTKWNNNVAILSGDVMLVESYRLLAMLAPELLPELLKIFNDTAAGVCEGQQFDMNFETMPEVLIADYIEMIRLKTAILLGASLKIGALIAGATSDEADALYRFGVNLGIAFQLQDDILDVYGDPEKFGKQVGGDILSNKKTFLLINARRLAEGSDKKELEHWISAESVDAVQKVSAVTNIYNRLNIRQLAQQAMNDFADQALKALDSISVPDDRKYLLRTFAVKLTERDY